MRKITIIVCFAFYQIVLAQVRVYPYIGFSYAPREYTTLTRGEIESKSLDFIFGLEGKVKVNNRFNFVTRISYSDRKNFVFRELSFIPTKSIYNHKDLNIDLAFQYIIDDLYIGAGPSLVYKINTKGEILNEISGNIFKYDNQQYLFGFNISVDYDLGYFIPSFRFHYLSSEKIYFGIAEDYYKKMGNARFDLGVCILIHRIFED